MTAVTDDVMKSLMRTLMTRPTAGIRDTGDSWGLDVGPRINKRRATFTDGFGYDLHPKSHFYKRWFDFPETNKRGWAVIFQVAPPGEKWARMSEYFAAWVPPEREADADRWIEFLNGEIRKRLDGK